MRWKAAWMWLRTAFPVWKPWVWATLRVYVFLMTSLVFSLFILEEACQSYGFGCFVLQSIPRTSYSWDVLDTWERQVDSLEKASETGKWTCTWTWPFTWLVNSAFRHFFEAQLQYVHIQRVRLAVEKEYLGRKKR